MHTIVTVRDVSFELPNGRVLFDKIHFNLDSKLTALVGVNGVGKTCLAKILTGELEARSGVISRASQINFFAQHETPQQIRVSEYLVDNYEWSLLKERLLKGIDPETMCTKLSGGQWMRVRLIKAIGPHFLILDEPTNDLDREGREALLLFLKEFSYGALLISHDRECLQLCETIYELSNKGLAKYGDGWNAYENEKQREIQNLKYKLDQATRKREQALADRQEQKAQQEKRNRRGAKEAERGGLPKILIGGRKRRAQVTSGKIDVATLEKAEASVREAFEAYNDLKQNPLMYSEISGVTIPNQKLIAEAIDFNIQFKNWIYASPLNFCWRGNIRLALKGKNGSGKSTLIKYLLNQIQPTTTGEFRRGNLNTLYIDQSCEGLDDNLSVLENVRSTCLLDESEVRNQLAKFLFTKETVFQTASSLSGGERLRACFAKGLLAAEKPELLILDEPTNNLDLQNIKFLEDLICEFKGALIIVSHDEVFLKNCAVTEEFYSGL